MPRLTARKSKTDRRRLFGSKPLAAAPVNLKFLKMAIPSCENFSACYMELCKQQRLRPLPIICLTLPHTLNFTTDRVKLNDWGPILNSLSLDRSLKTVNIRSRYPCRSLMGEVNAERKTRTSGRTPVVLTRYLLEWLSHSIAQCVRNSSALTYLQLEGIPLPPDCLAALCVGLANTETLQHLSLQRCYIGDNSCALICRTITDVQSIRSLNLSQCDLSSSCGPALAAALCKQKLLLFHETWKESLRYRDPDLNAMPGLRRFTLNGNPNLGDTAVVEIIEAVQDSLWLKAIDLQHCGITDAIADDILDLLEKNTTLEVVDVRLNANLSQEVVAEVFRRLQVNHDGARLEYRFLNLPQKDNRAVSAGVRRRDKQENIMNNLRPNSAICRNSKRPCQMAPIQKLSPAPPIPRKIKLKPPVPIFRPVKNKEEILSPRKSPKASLLLDLREHMVSEIDSLPTSETLNDELDNEVGSSQESVNTIQEVQTTELDVLAGQLIAVKAKHEKLIEEMEQMEVELEEERSRREVAESKLRSMKVDLGELESALKAKELETRGYLLVSQQSLDEISDYFEKLLDIMDDFSRNPDARWREGSSEAEETESIKRRVSLLIRKTKSENFRRNGQIPPTKITKSTGDIRANMPGVRIEEDVGDAANINSPSLIGSSRKKKSEYSPCERAREIFAQIINSPVMLKLDSNIS